MSLKSIFQACVLTSATLVAGSCQALDVLMETPHPEKLAWLGTIRGYIDYGQDYYMLELYNTEAKRKTCGYGPKTGADTYFLDKPNKVVCVDGQVYHCKDVRGDKARMRCY